MDLTSEEDLSYLTIIINISKNAYPGLVGLMFFQGIEMTNALYVGTMKDSELIAGLGLARLINNIFCLSLCMGLNSALEPLIS